MSFFQSLVGERKVVDASALTWQELLGASATSKTGLSVSITSALRVATVLACCRALGEDLAQLPLKLYRRQGRTTKEARDHPVFNLLSQGPNDWQTSMEWREGGMLHATLALGHFAIVSMNGNREVLELLPIAPEAVTIRQGADWTVSYVVGGPDGRRIDLPRDQIFHVRGPGWLNFAALQLVVQAREAIGLAMATEESQARMHSNGARPMGLITTDRTLSKEAKSRLKTGWADSFAGLANFGKTPVLDEGMKWQPIGFSGVDAQHLETRKHQIEEIARMMGVFPQRIGYSDKTSTYASAEQFFIAHVVYSVMPWVRRWEAAISRDLLSPRERAAGLFPKFNVNALLRGDAKSRAEFYKAALGTASSPGWMTQNEVRDYEDLDPMDGLDQMWQAPSSAEKPPQKPNGATGMQEGMPAGMPPIDGMSASDT